MPGLSQQRKLKSLVTVTLGGIGMYGVIGFLKNDEKLYRNCVMPVVHLLDPERAHRLAVFASKHRLFPKSSYKDPETLKTSIFGKTFKNPVGIAAGFDKDGEAILGLQDIGFGFIEVGSVTPQPQAGNEKPRVFRLKEDRAVINRYGFNNGGHNAMLERVSHVKQSGQFDGILGVNLGKNKTSSDHVGDYVAGVRAFGPVADYLVINVSSPNTPGLRNLQGKKQLQELLSATVAARNSLPENFRPPLLLKLAPDLTPEDKKDIADVIQQKNCKVDGLIISNTTIERPSSLKTQLDETGGLSGAPLKDHSTKVIEEMYRLTKGQVPIVGVGGISSGKDAFEKILAGACAVQIYTCMVYEGPPVAARIKRELDELLRKNNYSSVAEAVGKAVKWT